MDDFLKYGMRLWLLMQSQISVSNVSAEILIICLISCMQCCFLCLNVVLKTSKIIFGILLKDSCTVLVQICGSL